MIDPRDFWSRNLRRGWGRARPRTLKSVEQLRAREAVLRGLLLPSSCSSSS